MVTPAARVWIHRTRRPGYTLTWRPEYRHGRWQVAGLDIHVGYLWITIVTT